MQDCAAVACSCLPALHSACQCCERPPVDGCCQTAVYLQSWPGASSAPVHLEGQDDVAVSDAEPAWLQAVSQAADAGSRARGAIRHQDGAAPAVHAAQAVRCPASGGGAGDRGRQPSRQVGGEAPLCPQVSTLPLRACLATLPACRQHGMAPTSASVNEMHQQCPCIHMKHVEGHTFFRL